MRVSVDGVEPRRIDFDRVHFRAYSRCRLMNLLMFLAFCDGREAILGGMQRLGE